MSALVLNWFPEVFDTTHIDLIFFSINTVMDLLKCIYCSIFFNMMYALFFALYSDAYQR